MIHIGNTYSSLRRRVKIRKTFNRIFKFLAIPEQTQEEEDFWRGW